VVKYWSKYAFKYWAKYWANTAVNILGKYGNTGQISLFIYLTLSLSLRNRPEYDPTGI
jgi:hypothetical protein